MYAFLLLLLLGPLIAPLFQATGLPFVADSGALAHDMLSRYLCPTPAKSYALLGFPMAVCARCWGATIGLWGAWFLCKSQLAARRSQTHQSREPRTEDYASADPSYLAFCSWFFHQPWVLRLCLVLGALLLWTLEINAWAAAPLPALILNGINGGFWAGMFAASLRLGGRSVFAQKFGLVRR